MSSIVLATVGRAVGTSLGGVAGGQIGSLLGAQLGGSIGRGSKQTSEGPRLEELAVQTSTYGRTIPMVFGTVRIAGNMIWSRPIREVATTTTVRSGGKGGGAKKSTSTTTQYSYYVTLAIAVCEGEITRIDRVWADAKLLDLSLGTYRMYRGTEDQLPDPLIESYEGVGNTPAYRGMAYVVIEDFPMSDFGNRIPNFTFEVTRRMSQQDVEDQPVESLVSSVMLIPGSGEFVYDTQTQFKITGTSAGGHVIQQGYRIALNQHTAEGRANALVALDQLQQTFPNLEWVGVAVNWFGTTMDIASCEIWPSVEYKDHVKTEPDNWQVAGYTRATGREIGRDAGLVRYGGTPDDGSIVRLLDELQDRGLKVFFYPMMLMDVEGKPWRGFLTGSSSEVNNFFTKTRGYRNFILHYANLVAGKVDAFAIGTEMRDLTKITSSTGVFPVVDHLIELAEDVKAILGSGVKLTYAADWSEYHHTDGGWYHLDPLWASDAIDMVGIDAYFPLTDAVQTGYDAAAIRAGWTSGEGYDFYYSDEARTIQSPLAPEYAWKNIAWWWSNAHTNPDSSPTDWVPESKPIWFTEYGFASVDGCTNEPNVFVDAGTEESAYPRFSRGRVDFMAQRTAIAATEAEWAESAMVTQRFLWSWDARPYPYWPDLRNVWADGPNWVSGHWVQGKLGASHVAPAVRQIAERAGLDAAAVNVQALQMLLDGFVIHERMSARQAIDQLMQAYFFSMKEQGSQLVALPRDATVDATASVEECLPMRVDQQEVACTLARTEDLTLPDRVEVHYLDRLQSYGAELQAATRGTQAATDTMVVRLGLVLSEAHARAIADIQLADRWAERSAMILQLPIRYARLEPGDLLEFSAHGATHRIRLHQVQIGKPGVVRLKGVIDAAEAWDGYIAPTLGGDGSDVAPVPETRLEILDIPAFPGNAQDVLSLRFAACGTAEGWIGATIMRVPGSGDEEILLSTENPATMGNCITVLADGPSQLFDRMNHVDIALLGDVTLSSATESEVLNGANIALIGDELVQFTTAESLGGGSYRLSGLLRGRLGTEYAAGSHAIGDRFVLLDGAVAHLSLPATHTGLSWTLRASSFGTVLTTGSEQTHLIQGRSLKPLSPVHLRAIRDSSGDIMLRWIRRARIEGEWRDYIDVPLMEQNEQYDVTLLDGATVKRSWRVDTNTQAYTAAEQVTDFGSPPTSLTLRIQQLSALIGPGETAERTVPVE